MSLLPENDRWNETRAQLLVQMDVSMGGRVAWGAFSWNWPYHNRLAIKNGFSSDCACWFKNIFKYWVYVYFSILGASSDFDNATKIANWMVTKLGMSEKVIANFTPPSCIKWWLPSVSLWDRVLFFKTLFFYWRERAWEGGWSEGKADSQLSREPRAGS